MDKKKFELSSEDRELAKNLINEEEKKKKKEKKKEMIERIKASKEIRKQKELYEEQDESKIDPKYHRKHYDVDKSEQKKFQFQQRRKNKTENVLKAKWEAKSQYKAEKKLKETEILRVPNDDRKIEFEDDDVFSSTLEVKQEDIAKSVDLLNQKKIFDIELNKFGPYKSFYNASGRHVLLASKKGHIATFDWKKFELITEHNVYEQVRDATWIMDNSMYALAQNRYTYIYDSNGAELHRCRDFEKVKWLEYFQFHFLLVGTSSIGNVIYKDISLGKNVGNVKVGLDTSVCTRNPYNSLLCLGHLNGTVSMVTPRDEPKKPVISMLCHQSPIVNISVEETGNYMMTTSVDNNLRVWDIRKTFQPLIDIHLKEDITTTSISQRGYVALGSNKQVKVWDNILNLDKEAYMKIDLPRNAVLQNINFCPFEDILGIGHSIGFSSALIPGCGEPTFDSKMPNPFSTDKHIADWNVRSLLDKIPASMIVIDPTIIGTTGERKEDYVYDENVEMDEKLKEKLESIGIVEKKTKSSTREELFEEMNEKEDKLREMKIGKEWWKKEGTNALDRFASGKIQKEKPKDKEIDSDEEIPVKEEEEEEEKKETVIVKKEIKVEKREKDSSDDENIKDYFNSKIKEEDQDEEDEENDNNNFLEQDIKQEEIIFDEDDEENDEDDIKIEDDSSEEEQVKKTKLEKENSIKQEENKYKNVTVKKEESKIKVKSEPQEKKRKNQQQEKHQKKKKK